MQESEPETTYRNRPVDRGLARPEGGSRQACRKTIAYKHARQKTQYDGEFAQDRAQIT